MPIALAKKKKFFEMIVCVLLTSIVSVFTSAIGWVAYVATTIAGQPILLISCVAIPLCGLGVGMFKRLLSARA